MREKHEWKRIVTASAVVGAFGLWHFMDVRAGASATGGLRRDICACGRSRWGWRSFSDGCS